MQADQAKIELFETRPLPSAIASLVHLFRKWEKKAAGSAPQGAE